MKILATAIAYSIFIVSVVWLFIYALSLISEFLRFVDKRFPKVWVLGGISLVLVGVVLGSYQHTVMALLCAIMGMLLVAIGGLVWWLGRRQSLERPVQHLGQSRSEASTQSELSQASRSAFSHIPVLRDIRT